MDNDKHQQFKSDIVNAGLLMQNQLGRLRMLDKKFTAMDKDLHHQIAVNIKAGNNARAKALANELSNIRRIQRTTQNTSIALEMVVIRFSTINEFAMILETINPTIEMIKDIQKDISKTIPAANGVLSEMTSMTSDILVNSNIRSDIGKVSTPIDTDALSILNEVEGILEDEAKARLPEVPTIASPYTVRIDRETNEEQQLVEKNRVMIEG